MKTGIHPKYFETTMKCACGYASSVRSTRKDVHVEICSNCHPFYTGKQKLVDTAGRIDKFNRKFKKVQALKTKQAQQSITTEIPAAKNISIAPTSEEPVSPQ